MKRNRTKIVLLSFALVLVAVGVLAWRPLAIEYHKRALERTNVRLLRASTAEAIAGIGSSSETESGRLAVAQGYHCDSLVKLGYFFHDSYEMDKVPVSIESHSLLVLLWPTASPNYRYASLSSDLTFDVYDLPSRRSDWESFIRRNNRPNLVSRFGESVQAEQ